MQQSHHPVVVGLGDDSIPVGLARHQPGEPSSPFLLQFFSAGKDEDKILRCEPMVRLIRSI